MERKGDILIPPLQNNTIPKEDKKKKLENYKH